MSKAEGLVRVCGWAGASACCIWPSPTRTSGLWPTASVVAAWLGQAVLLGIPLLSTKETLKCSSLPKAPNDNFNEHEVNCSFIQLDKFNMPHIAANRLLVCSAVDYSSRNSFPVVLHLAVSTFHCCRGKWLSCAAAYLKVAFHSWGVWLYLVPLFFFFSIIVLIEYRAV